MFIRNRCISADTKIQASIKHETEVKTIHRENIVPFEPVVFIQVQLTNAPLSDQKASVRCCSFSNSGT